jgi:hypothetical protein
MYYSQWDAAEPPHAMPMSPRHVSRATGNPCLHRWHQHVAMLTIEATAMGGSAGASMNRILISYYSFPQSLGATAILVVATARHPGTPAVPGLGAGTAASWTMIKTADTHKKEGTAG